MLNHHDIHAIISQIAQTLDCPQCKRRIQPNNIQITGIVGQDCLFDASCDRCEIEMSLSAHVEKSQSEEAMTYNKSSQIVHDNVVTEGVSADDVLSIQDELRNFCGSFIQTFSKAYY